MTSAPLTSLRTGCNYSSQVGLHCTLRSIIPSLYPLDVITILSWDKKWYLQILPDAPWEERNQSFPVPEAEPAKARVNDWVFLCTEWSRRRMLLPSLWGSFLSAFIAHSLVFVLFSNIHLQAGSMTGILSLTIASFFGIWHNSLIFKI